MLFSLLCLASLIACIVSHRYLVRAYEGASDRSHEARAKAIRQLGVAGFWTSILLAGYVVATKSYWPELGFLIGTVLVSGISQARARARLMEIEVSIGRFVKSTALALGGTLLMYGIYYLVIFAGANLSFGNETLSAVLPILAVPLAIFIVIALAPLTLSVAAETKKITDPSIVGKIHVQLDRAGLPRLDVYQMPTKWAKVANAFVSGLTWLPKPFQARIVLSDSLLTDFSEHECQAIVAHEIAHLTSRHILKRAFIPFGLSLLALVPFGGVIGICMQLPLSEHGLASAVLAGVIVIGFVLTQVFLSRQIVRNQELDADWKAIHRYGIAPELYFATLLRLYEYSGLSIHKRDYTEFFNVNTAHPTAADRKRIVMESPASEHPPFEMQFLKTLLRKWIPRAAVFTAVTWGIAFVMPAPPKREAASVKSSEPVRTEIPRDEAE